MSAQAEQLQQSVAFFKLDNGHSSTKLNMKQPPSRSSGLFDKKRGVVSLKSVNSNPSNVEVDFKDFEKF